MMIPLKAELRLAYKPVVTYVIVALCIIIYAFQANNQNEIAKSAAAYCSGINQFQREFNQLDFLSHYPSGCVDWITFYYGLADKSYIPYFFRSDYKNLSLFSNNFPASAYYETLALFDKHIEAFSLYAPVNLDGALVYDPSTLNVFTMVTSVLSHGSFLHLFFNLVFFLAFAPALEALVGNSWKFLGVVFLMVIGTNLVYAMAMISADFPTPTLGLSGIVMGMMGFAASFMPKARIKTFYYLIVIPTPVWLLSTYYIGWDMYDLYSRTDHGGVNVVVHVAGGVIGVLMMVLFRNRHKEISDELHDEIEFMQNQRTSIADTTETKGEIAFRESQEKIQKQEHDYLADLHRLVRVDNHSEVINVILNDHNPEHAVIERYEFLLNQLHQWKLGRSYDCIGRLIIDLRLAQQHSGGALRIAKELLNVRGDILLANPAHVLPLAEAAKSVNDFELAYALVKNADKRYFGKCQGELFPLFEMGLLHLHLNRTPEALALLKSIFDNRHHPHRSAAVTYAKQIGVIGGTV